MLLSVLDERLFLKSVHPIFYQASPSSVNPLPSMQNEHASI